MRAHNASVMYVFGRSDQEGRKRERSNTVTLCFLARASRNSGKVGKTREGYNECNSNNSIVEEISNRNTWKVRENAGRKPGKRSSSDLGNEILCTKSAHLVLLSDVIRIHHARNSHLLRLRSLHLLEALVEEEVGRVLARLLLQGGEDYGRPMASTLRIPNRSTTQITRLERP